MMRHHLKVLLVAHLALSPVLRANDCSTDLEKVAFHLQPDSTFSHYLLATLYRPKEDVIALRTPKTPANLGRALYNEFVGFLDMGYLFARYPRKRLTQKPIYPAFEKLSNQLSSLGRAVAEEIRGKRFVDLGAGDPDKSFVPRVVAQSLGARDYVGVDIGHTKDFKRVHEFKRAKPPFEAHFIKNDILGYLTKLADERKEEGPPLFFYMEGIEHNWEGEANFQNSQSYMRKVMEALAQVTRPGDSLFLGGVVSYLHPPSDLARYSVETPFPTNNMKEQEALSINPADYGFERKETHILETSYVRVRTQNSRHDLWVRKAN
jgi:hypothetical protein